MKNTQTKRLIFGIATLVVTCGLTVSYRLGRAHADGIAAVTPMYYSGTLQDAAGNAITGTHNLQLNFWNDAASTSSTNLLCTTMAAGTMITNGRFRVPIDSTCTPVVHSTPDLWLDVQVDGASLGRSKIGAVPFAVEAGRAADLTPAASQALVPPGTVVAFGGTAIPTGWLLCDGSALSRATYATLFATVGTLHGSGDGTTTFNLPDYRGRFLRGTDLATGRDPDRAGRTAAHPGGSTGDAVGSVEDWDSLSHVHGIPGAAVGLASGPIVYSLPATGASFINTAVNGGGHAGGSGSESRPTNASVNFIMKY